MDMWTKRSLTVPNVLIGMCVALYLIGFFIPQLDSWLLFTPLTGWYQPWRFLTSAFLHGGLLHLACNLVFLYILGKMSQRFFSSWQFLWVYLLCAWGGSLAAVIWARFSAENIAVVGASAAVLGVCAALAVYVRHLSDLSANLGGLVVINLLIGFLIPNVAWYSHLGGIVIGLLLGAALRVVATSSGRAGAKYLDAAIPDIVDRHQARQTATRIRRIGNLGSFLGCVLLLGFGTYAAYLL